MTTQNDKELKDSAMESALLQPVRSVPEMYAMIKNMAPLKRRSFSQMVLKIIDVGIANYKGD